jgi:hypothetical protein
MARLTSAERNALPDSAFAGPGRSYPVNDASHARNAKARASEMAGKGKLSESAKTKIDHEADRKLGIKEDSEKDRKIDKIVGVDRGKKSYGGTGKAAGGKRRSGEITVPGGYAERHGRSR